MTSLAAHYNENAEKPETLGKKKEVQSPFIFSTASEQFQLLLWHPAPHLVSTAPWGWVGDLYFSPAVFPDVVNIQIVIQVRLL